MKKLIASLLFIMLSAVTFGQKVTLGSTPGSTKPITVRFLSYSLDKLPKDNWTIWVSFKELVDYSFGQNKNKGISTGAKFSIKLGNGESIVLTQSLQETSTYMEIKYDATQNAFEYRTTGCYAITEEQLLKIKEFGIAEITLGRNRGAIHHVFKKNNLGVVITAMYDFLNSTGNSSETKKDSK